MSSGFLMDLLKKFVKSEKGEAYRAFYHSFVTSLINSIIQVHEC